ncbi:MAG: hypothetical protein J6N51_15465 [Selenomonas sp.]|nr:hypothetical protein [Selenomonas sp.]MBP3730954.1 hypothetical protein [Mailhella sp.]
MDRVLMTQDDVKMLFVWLQEHKEQVRQFPCPLKAVEIVLTHNAIRIKGIRDGKWLKLYVYSGNESLGKMEFEIDFEAQHLLLRKCTTILSRDDRASILSGYFTLMAFMVYEKPELVKQDEPFAMKTRHKPRGGSPTKKQTTYILRQRKAATRGAQGGHHTSPRGVFTVRGHYRKYRSGKTVWIAEYKKGTGDKRHKRYKMGGKIDG